MTIIFKIFYNNLINVFVFVYFRHSRRDGFFKFINKKKSYGVKLVYQFGPKAIKHCSWLQSIIKTNDLD